MSYLKGRLVSDDVIPSGLEVAPPETPSGGWSDICIPTRPNRAGHVGTVPGTGPGRGAWVLRNGWKDKRTAELSSLHSSKLSWLRLLLRHQHSLVPKKSGQRLNEH